VNSFWQDIRYGLRMLGKNPGFTAVAVLTLALGIGANTAMFSVVHGVLLKPLPYTDADRLVVFYEKKIHFENGSISYPNFLDWQKDNTSFASMAAYRPIEFTLSGVGEPERLTAEMTSSEFFPTLGVAPLAGRLFTADEDRLGASPVALISEGFWRRKFGTAADTVGRTITLDGVSHLIVGIIPASFRLEMWLFRPSDVYTPIGQWTYDLFRHRDTAMGMDAIGRLKPGVTLEQARADFDGLTGRLAALYPKEDKGLSANLIPLKENIVRDVQTPLLLLLGAVGLVLLIACVNVANLVLARSTGRAREFGIRNALGATWGRLIRQLITESTLLAMAGSILGLLLASFGVQAAIQLALTLRPGGIPLSEQIALDWRVLAFTTGITILVGILFGLAPALKARSLNLQGTLKEGARGMTATRSRAQHALVVAEFAMALVLLVGAGLMIRSLLRLWSVHPGFEADRAVTFYLSLDPSTYKASPEAVQATFRQASETIASVPGVESVSLLAGSLPMRGDSDDPFWIEGRPKPLADTDKPWALWYQVDPTYLKAMGIPLRRGRFFTAEDTARAPRVAVIDESFATKYFPDENPIGRRIVDDYVGTAEIVGIVGHVKHWGLDDKSTLHAQMYFPLAQIRDEAMPDLAKGVGVVLRSQGSPADVMGSVRAAVTRLNGQPIIFDVRTMNDVISASLANRRFLMDLLVVFAALALLLGSVGIYGVLSYLVGQRIPEIGVRLALGAQRGDVLRLILNEGLRMTFLGVAIGLAGALALSRLMNKVLYGISAADPVTFLGVAVLLTVVALAACYVPARRATRVDPLVALRYE